MAAAEHDRAVAVVSHAPQILSSLLAARLLDSSDTVVSIAGQGLRDMTRIAASDADLWVEILSANATPVSAVLGALRADLDSLLHALGSIDQGGEDVLAETLRRGNAGRDRVPGKHGARPSPTAVVPVAVPDQPGELGRLFAAVAEAGYSVEDVRIEHVLGRPTGVVEITVGEVSAAPLATALGCPGLGRAGLTGGVRQWDVRPDPPPLGALGCGVVDPSRAVVAIDGPSGSGKSSTSRGVARALGLDYLDTGAMYRAMAWYMLDRGVDVADPAAVAALADRPTLRLHDRP